MKHVAVMMLFLLSCLSYGDVLETPLAVPSNLHVYNSEGSTFVDMMRHGCSGVRYYLSPDHEKYETIVSILLAAQVANKQVVLRYDGCVNGDNPQGNIVGAYMK